MQQHTKQKLIGAGIVVVFLAIAIPFLLAGSMRQSKIEHKPVVDSALNTNTNVNTHTVSISQLNNQSSAMQVNASATPVNTAAPKTIAIADIHLKPNVDKPSISKSTSPILTAQNDSSALSVTPLTQATNNKNNALPKDMISTAEAANRTMPQQEAQVASPKTENVMPSNTANNGNAISNAGSSSIPSSSSNNASSDANQELHASLLQKEANIVGNTAHKMANSTKKQHQHVARKHKKETQGAHTIAAPADNKINKVDKADNKNEAAATDSKENTKSIRKQPANTQHKTWAVEMGGFASLKEAQNALYALPRTYPIVIEKNAVSQNNNTQAQKETVNNSKNQYRVIIKNITSESEAQKIAEQIKKLEKTDPRHKA